MFDFDSNPLYRFITKNLHVLFPLYFSVMFTSLFQMPQCFKMAVLIFKCLLTGKRIQYGITLLAVSFLFLFYVANKQIYHFKIILVILQLQRIVSRDFIHHYSVFGCQHISVKLSNFIYTCYSGFHC